MEHNDDDHVIFKYASTRNVTFGGRVDTGILWSEWRDMSEAERDEVLGETVLELVEIWVEGED